MTAPVLADAAGSRRRLQALAVCGWSERALAAKLGGTPRLLARIMAGQPSVTAEIAARISILYDQLWNQSPPGRTKAERISATLAREHASRRGWAPPLAWDDEEIDDPAAQPHPWKRSPYWHAEDLVAEVSELVAWGYSRAQAAMRLGTDRDTVDKAFARVARKVRAA